MNYLPWENPVRNQAPGLRAVDLDELLRTHYELGHNVATADAQKERDRMGETAEQMGRVRGAREERDWMRVNIMRLLHESQQLLRGVEGFTTRFSKATRADFERAQSLLDTAVDRFDRREDQ